MAKKARKVVKENKLFPGRPNYTGPQRGWFAFVHHGKLFEHATEPIKNRVKYVRECKPPDERRIRLHHILSLAPLNHMLSARSCVCADARYDYEADRAVRAYVETHLPRHRWSFKFGSLKKANGRLMTG